MNPYSYEARPFWRRLVSKKVATYVGLSALAGTAIVAGYNTFKPEHGMASCDAIDVALVDTKKNIIEVKPKFHLTGDARFAGMTYIFDENTRSVSVPTAEAIQHDYPDSPADQVHQVEAIVDYHLNGQEFGGLPVCTTAVIFRS